MHSREGVGELFVVATPIGNLKDITLRALEVLKNVDVIACEDTRQTLKLLNAYGIKGKRLISYYEHNERERAEEILRIIKEGKRVALVSDAGTPCISDPGYRVVALARKEGINVIPIPGPSALIAALSASGFPTDRFYFGGFLPRKEKELRETLERFLRKDHTVVFYESPHRIIRTLKAISELFPGRRVGIFREITKLNEEFLSGRVEEVLEEVETGKAKGEIVLLLPPVKEEKREVDLDEVLKELKAKGLRISEAVREARRLTGLPKREVYRRALELFGD